MLLSIKSIDFAYSPKKEVIKDVSFDLKDGDELCISGANGKGKTTLLRLILGILTPTAGTIEKNLNSNELFYIPASDRALYLRLRAGSMLKFLLAPYECCNSRHIADFYADNFGHLDFNKKCGELSNGQRRKLFLAAAMMIKPKLILFDEIFTALDKESLSLFLDAVTKSNSALVYTSTQYEKISINSRSFELL